MTLGLLLKAVWQLPEGAWVCVGLMLEEKSPFVEELESYLLREVSPDHPLEKSPSTGR